MLVLVQIILNSFYNPFAPRKAKIVCNFGLSGCNRVNEATSWNLVCI